MKKAAIILFTGLSLAFSPVKVSAHCPLCTGGAGAAALVAAYFGVTHGALGVLLGGFSVALSLWLARLVKRQFIPKQRLILFWALFASTILPFYFMFKGDYVSRYIMMGGDYGSLTNRTYILNLFIVGAIAGALIVHLSPNLSRWIMLRNGGRQFFKFQGMILTLLLLVIGAILMQVWPR